MDKNSLITKQSERDRKQKVMAQFMFAMSPANLRGSPNPKLIK